MSHEQRGAVPEAASAAAEHMLGDSNASLTLLARCWRGAPVWRAHREHLYQRLVLRGWSPARVASVLAALLIGVCWPGAAWSVVAGVLPALFVYGLLVIIWLWLRSRSVQPGANLPI